MSVFTIAVICLCVLSVGLGISSLVTRDRRSAWLSVISALLVPVAGFLSTVLQLIAAFRVVGAADPASKATLLSVAIGEAMRATAIGLAGFVPCLIIGIVALARAPNAPRPLPPVR